MLLNTLFEELTGRGSGTEAQRHERYTWLEQLRFTNPLADEGGPMAGIPYYQWCRLPQALVVAGQHTDLLVGTTSALYLVFEAATRQPSRPNWACNTTPTTASTAPAASTSCSTPMKSRTTAAGPPCQMKRLRHRWPAGMTCISACAT